MCQFKHIKVNAQIVCKISRKFTGAAVRFVINGNNSSEIDCYIWWIVIDLHAHCSVSDWAEGCHIVNEAVLGASMKRIKRGREFNSHSVKNACKYVHQYNEGI